MPTLVIDANIFIDIEVHGTLWLMKRMNRAELITANQASLAFEKMRKCDRRLPWNKIEELLANMAR